MTPLLASAMTEVRSLHEAFEDLFTGRSRDFGRCAKALAMDFSMVAPDGSRLDRGAVLGALSTASASPGFRIRIKDLTPIWEAEDSVLLTALFTAEAGAPCGVVWRYLQETWTQVAAPRQEK
jgi:hypothetical protein